MVERVAVIGAGIGGLCTALALAPTGREITLFERDPPPPEGGPEEAFDHWGRRGVGHLRHSHGFLARLRGIFAREHPKLLAELAEAGVREISFADSLPEPLRSTYSPRPGDDDLAAFVARRTTVELVMRAYVERQPNVSLRSGVFVKRPIIERVDQQLVAKGLAIEENDQETEVLVDLVVDSGGRNSIAIDALCQAGARIVEEGEDCAILYYTRFYRFRDGQDEPPRSPHGGTGDLGYLKFGVFRADNHTFSVTIAVPEVEQTLRTAVLHPEVFESICQALPGVAPWTEPGRSEPITKVLGMGDLMSRWREFAPDGKAAVLGLLPIGDAMVRTNPLYGRGCSFAAVEAHILRDVIEATADPAERLVRYSAEVKAALRPFYDDMAAQDRAAAARALRGLDPNRTTSWSQKLGASFVRDGLTVAVRSDPDLLRQALRSFHMLELPMKLQSQPMTLVKGLAAWSRGRAANAAFQPPRAGPARAEMFQLLSLPLTADFERVEEPGGVTASPRNVVVVLLDSLNRHMLGAYGGTEFETPNLDRFAAQSARFTRHYTGSLPCMPARHDILCGALDFLWKAWGSVEIWEDAITYPLREAGVTTQLISDHPHLFEHGGENYHCDFEAWDYQRGHEGDAWKTRADPSWAGAPAFGRGWMPYDNSRGWFRGEADFPGPKTMAASARWIEDNAGAHERFFLFVDEFDPHEPFDTPEPWASKYDPEWEGAHLIWPPYAVGAKARGVLDDRQGRQIRAQYGAKLSMIDHWFGKLLDSIDAKGLGEDTMVVLCTDHGHYLGEKDIWGKPGCPIYQPMGHIPLMIRGPGIAAGDCAALTTAVDIFATIADVFGVLPRQRTQGRTLMPLLRGEAASVRDWLLTGVWGREVVLVTGQHKYVRGPAGANAPLSMLSNRWSTMPTHGALSRHLALPLPDERAYLDHMPGSDVPVIHQTWAAGDAVPFWARFKPTGSYVFDLENDPAEETNLKGGALEAQLAEQLRAALVELEAPKTQLERLGFA